MYLDLFGLTVRLGIDLIYAATFGSQSLDYTIRKVRF